MGRLPIWAKVVLVAISLIIYFILLWPSEDGSTDDIGTDCTRSSDCRKYNNLDELLAEHKKYLEKSRRGKPVDLSYADLRNQDLSGADLRYAILLGANLNKANLSKAHLDGATLDCAQLIHANLSEATLFQTELRFVHLDDANLANANLFGADLRRAKIIRTKLDNTNLQKTRINDAVFEPNTVPEASYLAGIQGLNSTKLNDDNPNPAGLWKLRKALQDGGIRHLERETTYAIEKAKDQQLITEFKINPWNYLSYLMRYIAFDLTTGYGNRPFKALIILVEIMIGMALIYFLVIWRNPNSNTFILPGEILIITTAYPGTSLEADPSTNKSNQLMGGFCAALGWSIYYSTMTSFSFGFREFNVSRWIERIQRSPFALISKGWVRTVSGIQSIISLYLFVIWLLTYFGRPFQ